jgi:hypothetical protein
MIKFCSELRFMHICKLHNSIPRGFDISVKNQNIRIDE